MDYKIIVFTGFGRYTDQPVTKSSHPGQKEALMNAQEAGNVVVLASGGGPLAGAGAVSKGAGAVTFRQLYPIPITAGMIVNCKTGGNPCFLHRCPGSPIRRLSGWQREHRVDILTYEGEEIITNNVECPYAIAESNINHLPLRQVEDMKSHVDFKVPKFLDAG